MYLFIEIDDETGEASTQTFDSLIDIYHHVYDVERETFPDDTDEFRHTQPERLKQQTLKKAAAFVLRYANDIANNDTSDVKAQNCVKVLESIEENASDALTDFQN